MEHTKTYPKLTTELIEKYNQRVPRYTSYPTVPNWNKTEYGPEEHLDQLHQISTENDPISMYVHIPFCERRCLFCGCNVLVTKRRDRSDKYLNYLFKEIDKTSEVMHSRNEVIQLHIGGGTPTHLAPDQLESLLNKLSDKYRILDNAELSIEIHPSITSTRHIDILREFNFNRLSMGVQDFDPVVQENLNRFQTYEETKTLIEYSRNADFKSINVDLIYGLPYQTKGGFSNTINLIKQLHPDRIALYSYAHFPTIFPHHKHIPLEVIATGNSKLDLFLMAREHFLEFDYEQIGFDHFSTIDDDLYLSYLNKTLRRNFMGYSTKSGTDMIAFGYSAISELSSSYAQNTKDMHEYERLVDKYGTATVKGHLMSDRDKFLKELIMEILCLGQIDYNSIEMKYPEQFDELQTLADNSLKEFIQNGFISRSSDGWKLSQEGNIFARIIAAKFDDYLNDTSHLFSKSV